MAWQYAPRLRGRSFFAAAIFALSSHVQIEAASAEEYFDAEAVYTDPETERSPLEATTLVPGYFSNPSERKSESVPRPSEKVDLKSWSGAATVYLTAKDEFLAENVGRNAGDAVAVLNAGTEQSKLS